MTTAGTTAYRNASRVSKAYLVISYIVLTAISCLSIYRSPDWTKLKLAHVLFLCLAFVHLALFFKTANMRTLLDVLKKYSVWIVVLTLLTLFIYVVQTSSISTIKTGLEKLGFQMITVLVAVSAVYLFEEKAVDYTFWGFVLFNTLSILLAFKDTGSMSDVIWSINKFITGGGDADGFMKRLELHDATFSFGLFLIYYILDGVKKNGWKFAICVFFYVIGFKRIGMAGCALASLVGVFLKHLDKRDAIRIGRVILAAFCIVGFLNVVIIRSGLFTYLMNLFDIDLMGRQNLYIYIEKFYQISPTFIGHGFESIKDILAMAGDLKVNETHIARMTAIHGDYLRMYIELGFWGFWIWELYFFVWLPRQFEGFSKLTYIAYVACTIYVAITYFTDNTVMFFLLSLVYRMVPLQFAVREER